MRRVAILGGTFNPVHMGHLTIAEMAREQLKLDKIIFVPANLPPHKGAGAVVAAADRFEMARLAVEGNSYFEVSDFEIRRAGRSYSIDTIHFFRTIYPSPVKIFFIIGSDLLSGLPSWKKIDEIQKQVTFIVVRREGFQQGTANVPHRLISLPGVQVSSSFVRQRVIAGKTVRYLVPDKVIEYIEQKKLYRKTI